MASNVNSQNHFYAHQVKCVTSCRVIQTTSVVTIIASHSSQDTIITNLRVTTLGASSLSAPFVLYISSGTTDHILQTGTVDRRGVQIATKDIPIYLQARDPGVGFANTIKVQTDAGDSPGLYVWVTFHRFWPNSNTFGT
jgi:hypothetical protein